MQNEIMGERLKGLFESYEDLADTIKSNEKMNGEHLTITSSFVNLAFFENKTKSETINSIKMCQDYIVQNNNLSFRREEYRNDVRRVKHNMKEMLNAKSKQKIQASEERDFLFEKCLNMEKKFKELNEGYAKVRINVKEMNQKRKQYGLDEEKLCKNCNKSYFEKDNYN